MKTRYNKLFTVIILLIFFILLVSCNRDDTPLTTSSDAKTSPKETIAKTTTESTTLSTTLTETTASITTTSPPDTAWKEKIDKKFYEEAVLENGKYYVNLFFNSVRLDYMEEDTDEYFINTYVKNQEDILFKTQGYGLSKVMVLRATRDEIEKYAKVDCVKRIAAYPKNIALDEFESVVAWGGGHEIDDIWALAENQNKQADTAQLPIVKIESKEELASFIAAIENNHTLTQDWDEYPSFMSVCERYNEAFFENQSLLVIAVFDGTSSADYSVCGVFADKALTVALNRKSSAGGNSLLASWFITVALDKSVVQQASAIEAIVYR